MVRAAFWLVCGVLICALTAHAEDSYLHAYVGSWAYRITGTTQNTSQLDLQKDLGLRTSDRMTYALGITPGQLGWLPALELNYAHIAANGSQQVSPVPVAGLPSASTTRVDNRTDIDDTELNARWPYQLGPFTLRGGLTLTRLKGFVMVADQTSGQQQTQRVNQLFPLVSAALQWQPLASLRFTLSGDYIQYQANRADELEARAVWKFWGGLGLEGGYLRRHYKIIDPSYKLNARVSGARVGLVMDIPY